MQNKTIAEIIEPLVDNYIAVIELNRKFFDQMICVVFCVIPPTNQSFDHNYPFYGSLSERVGIAQALNRTLRNKCSEQNILFLDVYDYFATEGGDLNEKFSDGRVHIAIEHNDIVKRALCSLLFDNR